MKNKMRRLQIVGQKGARLFTGLNSNQKFHVAKYINQTVSRINNYLTSSIRLSDRITVSKYSDIIYRNAQG